MRRKHYLTPSVSKKSLFNEIIRPIMDISHTNIYPATRVNSLPPHAYHPNASMLRPHDGYVARP